MANDWINVQLQDVVSKLGDGLHGTPKYSENGEYYFINGNNLENGQIIFKEKTKRVDHTQYLKYKKELNERTLLVSINGTIGNVAYYNGEKVILGKSACYFNLKDDIDKGYVRYVLSGHYFQSYLNAFATGTTIQNVSLKSMREFSFPLPPIKEQKAIAHILGSLDDKIELNRQMNETLEAMAQALFKSWFVDFDPVIDNALAAGNAIPDEFIERAEQRKAIEKKDNADIQKLFPDEFEFTEDMGWIPKGWEVISFGDVSICFDRLRVPLSKKQRESKKPGLIPYHGATSVMDYINEWIFDDIYLLIGEDGSVIKEDGSPFVQYIWGKTWVNNHAHVLQGKNGVGTEHLMLFMQSQNLTAYVTGAVQLKINQGNMNRIPFLHAGGKINEEFTSVISPFYEKIRSATEENITLAKLRDTLLPKLMSGELRIPDADAMTKEV